MNDGSKHPSAADAEPTGQRRSSLFARLAERLDPSKAQEAKHSSSDAASVTSHTPLVPSEKGEASGASTKFERDEYAELMERTKGMTPDQIKEELAKYQKEYEDKYHETANVGRWQWKFAEYPADSKMFAGDYKKPEKDDSA